MKFITVSPTNVKHRHYVARETYGGGFVIVATCTSEETAKAICEAMNAERSAQKNYKPGTAEVTSKRKAA